MLAKNKPETEKELAELFEKMSALCRQYETAFETITQNREKEREDRKKRQLEGVAAAKARGVKLGRKPVQMPGNFAELVHKWEQGDINLESLLEMTGLKPTTFYKMLREHRKKAHYKGL